MPRLRNRRSTRSARSGNSSSSSAGQQARSPEPAAGPTTGAAATRIVSGRAVYEFLRDRVPEARRTLWLATADIKDLHIETDRGFAPFVQVLAGLVRRGVEVRLMHAKEPGPRFRSDFDRYPELIESPLFERLLCPRLHFKCVVLDGRSAYTGSANLTGAGMGAKSDLRRNFESGIITEEPALVRAIMAQFDEVFAGLHCPDCGRRDVCPDPIV